MILTYDVSGMKCASCSARVEKTANNTPGITNASVNLLKGSLQADVSSSEASACLVKAITDEGFPISLTAESACELSAHESKDNLLTFDVSGMKCASCSARVEKAAGGVEGISNPSVNLLKGTLQVQASNASAVEKLIETITNEGFGISQQKTEASGCASCAQLPETPKNTKQAKSLKAKQNKAQQDAFKRFIVSLVFMLPLMYISMSSMFGWPVHNLINASKHPITNATLQLLLCLPVLWVNKDRFVSGAKAFRHKAPNMDSLVSLGAGASVLYSLISFGNFLAVSSENTGLYVPLNNIYFDSAAMILTFVSLGNFLEARAKNKTTDAMEGLARLAPQTACLLKHGTETEIPISEVKVGDTLIVKTGESIPVDGVVVSGSGAADEAFITGESIPVSKEEQDAVVGASKLVSGWITMQATRVGKDTTLSGIIKLVDEANSSKAPIQRLADRISLVFVPTVIGLSVLTFIIWILATGNINSSFSHAIAVMVISCPCALGLATPTAIMVGTGQGARYGILIKSAEALEQAHDIKTIVFDKTGTLTTGKPAVVATLPNTNVAKSELLSCAASIEQYSEHPLACAITKFAEESNASLESLENFTQLAGRGLIATSDQSKFAAGNVRLMQEQDVDISSLLKQAQSYADQGATPLFFAKDNKLVGVIIIADEIKEDAKQSIAELNNRNITTVMLTGDNERCAHAVQNKLGINQVISDALPQDKERIIREFKQQGPVAMVGDGVNDAPALTRADLSLAIGAGTDIALDAADIVLMHSKLKDVVSALDLSKATVRIIKQNLFWALIYNAICIPIAAGALTGLGVNLSPGFAAAAMSMSSVCVVSNSLRLRRWTPKH